MNIQTHAQKRETANNKTLGKMTYEKKKRLGVAKEIKEELADAYQYLTYYGDVNGYDNIEGMMFLLFMVYNDVKKL